MNRAARVLFLPVHSYYLYIRQQPMEFFLPIPETLPTLLIEAPIPDSRLSVGNFALLSSPRRSLDFL